jgi:hypothetical protein
MAFDPKPSTWLGPGYTVATGEITLNTADNVGDVCVPELTDVEAHPTTGDIRRVNFALCELMRASWDATAIEDRPTRMQITRSVTQGFGGGGTLSYNYNISFTTDVSAEVADE